LGSGYNRNTDHSVNNVHSGITGVPASDAVEESFREYTLSDADPVTPDAGSLEIDRELSAGGSTGNLPKWLLRDSRGTLYYAKGRSKPGAFEPEAEVCAYRIARLFGMPAIKYDFAFLPELSEELVCLCRDYTRKLKVMSLFRYVQGVTGVNPASVWDGRAKYDLVTGVLPAPDREKHNAILFLDYIVGNKDRHLRNFDCWVRADGSIIGLVPVFDTGDSLFASEPETEILRACKSGNNFIHSKPYMNPHLAQLKMLQDIGHVPSLVNVGRDSIEAVINSCFIGKRAKHLSQYVCNNVSRLGLIL